MGGIQGYQAGSTFKAFTAGGRPGEGHPAIARSTTPGSPMNFGGKSFETCDGREQVYGKWNVKNSTGTATSHRHVPRRREMSVNTYFVQLELATGMCRVTKMAKKLGVKLGTRSDRDMVGTTTSTSRRSPSASVEVSPLSMAEAYATFAARGIHCDPIIIAKITTRNGKNLEPAGRQLPAGDGQGRGRRHEQAAQVGGEQGHRHPGQGLRRGRPQAGKTGTINSNEAVWFAGYTPEIAGVAMISIDNTKKPFIKSKKLRKAADDFRRQRRQGLPGSVDRLRTWRAPAAATPGQEDLEAGDGGVPQAGAQHLLQELRRSRIENGKPVTVPEPVRAGHLGGDRRSWRRQASPSRRSTSTATPRRTAPSSAGRRARVRRSPEFGTIYMTRTRRAATRPGRRGEGRGEGARRRRSAEEEERRRSEKKPPRIERREGSRQRAAVARLRCLRRPVTGCGFWSAEPAT